MRRTPEAADLSTRSIGIVGLGSVGSKVALTLARMGVQRFVLVDHDLVFPENLVRNALDWQSVGRHKADAVGWSIKNVNSCAEVRPFLLDLTGQESSSAVDGAARSLGGCDVIIDATAHSRVFNLLGAIAISAGKPLVWVEVFGGGVGGLVARFRPGLDATPQEARAAYLRFCSENPAPPGLMMPEDYSGEVGGQSIVQASDADVGLIAGHAARLAADTIAAASSQYPQSMYLVGLSREWVFRAPFDTIPIAAASAPVSQGDQELDSGNIAFLLDLYKAEKKDETAPSA